MSVSALPVAEADVGVAQELQKEQLQSLEFQARRELSFRGVPQSTIDRLSREEAIRLSGVRVPTGAVIPRTQTLEEKLAEAAMLRREPGTAVLTRVGQTPEEARFLASITSRFGPSFTAKDIATAKAAQDIAGPAVTTSLRSGLAKIDPTTLTVKSGQSLTGSEAAAISQQFPQGLFKGAFDIKDGRVDIKFSRPSVVEVGALAASPFLQRVGGVGRVFVGGGGPEVIGKSEREGLRAISRPGAAIILPTPGREGLSLARLATSQNPALMLIAAGVSKVTGLAVTTRESVRGLASTAKLPRELGIRDEVTPIAFSRRIEPQFLPAPRRPGVFIEREGRVIRVPEVTRSGRLIDFVTDTERVQERLSRTIGDVFLRPSDRVLARPLLIPRGKFPVEIAGDFPRPTLPRPQVPPDFPRSTVAREGATLLDVRPRISAAKPIPGVRTITEQMINGTRARPPTRLPSGAEVTEAELASLRSRLIKGELEAGRQVSILTLPTGRQILVTPRTAETLRSRLERPSITRIETPVLTGRPGTFVGRQELVPGEFPMRGPVLVRPQELARAQQLAQESTTRTLTSSERTLIASVNTKLAQQGALQVGAMRAFQPDIITPARGPSIAERIESSLEPFDISRRVTEVTGSKLLGNILATAAPTIAAPGRFVGGFVGAFESIIPPTKVGGITVGGAPSLAGGAIRIGVGAAVGRAEEVERGREEVEFIGKDPARLTGAVAGEVLGFIAGGKAIQLAARGVEAAPQFIRGLRVVSPLTRLEETGKITLRAPIRQITQEERLIADIPKGRVAIPSELLIGRDLALRGPKAEKIFPITERSPFIQTLLGGVKARPEEIVTGVTKGFPATLLARATPESRFFGIPAAVTKEGKVFQITGMEALETPSSFLVLERGALRAAFVPEGEAQAIRHVRSLEDFALKGGPKGEGEFGVGGRGGPGPAAGFGGGTMAAQAIKEAAMGEPSARTKLITREIAKDVAEPSFLDRVRETFGVGAAGLGTAQVTATQQKQVQQNRLITETVFGRPTTKVTQRPLTIGVTATREVTATGVRQRLAQLLGQEGEVVTKRPGEELLKFVRVTPPKEISRPDERMRLIDLTGLRQEEREIPILADLQRFRLIPIQEQKQKQDLITRLIERVRQPEEPGRPLTPFEEKPFRIPQLLLFPPREALGTGRVGRRGFIPREIINPVKLLQLRSNVNLLLGIDKPKKGLSLFD